MSDPITIGAGLGAGLSVLSGKSPFKGALMGGLGGAGYGAMTGSGWAGNLLSKGGVLGAGSAGTVAPGASGATQLMGSTEAISPFTPQGVLGTQTVTPGLTGAEQVLGQAGQQAMAQLAPLYTGQQGMFDTMGVGSPGVSDAIMTTPSVEGGGGYGALDRIGDATKKMTEPLTKLAEENPVATRAAASVALNNMLQPQPQYQMNVPPAPTPIPSKESVSTYVPASLRTQVARNVDPRLQSLYGYGRG
jgi:hypothetical protein